MARIQLGSIPGYHFVEAGDTLYDIAQAYFGDGNLWHGIFDANRNVITDPDKISIGQRLYIPAFHGFPGGKGS
jgi:nucleoid-associated protein YgaU